MEAPALYLRALRGTEKYLKVFKNKKGKIQKSKPFKRD